MAVRQIQRSPGATEKPETPEEISTAAVDDRESLMFNIMNLNTSCGLSENEAGGAAVRTLLTITNLGPGFRRRLESDTPALNSCNFASSFV